MTRRGSAHSRQYLATVTSSDRPFICIAPSPTSATHGRSGWANLAAIAYGTAQPMVSRLPDSHASWPALSLRSRA
jgi:hypothetical protein